MLWDDYAFEDDDLHAEGFPPTQPDPPPLTGPPELIWKLGLSNVPPYAFPWTLQTFPYREPNEDRVSNTLRRWLAGSPRVQSGIVLYGGPGRGKSGGALATVHEAVKGGIGSEAGWIIARVEGPQRQANAGGHPIQPAPICYLSWPALREWLRAAASNDAPRLPSDPPVTEFRILTDLTAERLELLVLDDIDVDTSSPWKEEVLTRILERPLNGLRLLVTMSEYPPELEDRLGARIIDRLMDRSHFALVPLQGHSLRELNRHQRSNEGADLAADGSE